jgi:MFS superfamily sulfate permease-like transporter
VLAAIVLVAVKGLIDVHAIARLRVLSRFEFRVAMTALVGVLFLGILKGILLASIASVTMLIRRAADPHVAFLGRVPGTRRFSDLARNPDNESVEGVLVFRTESSLLYFNVENVLRAVLARVREAEPTLVVCDLSTSPHVDVAGATMIESLSDALTRRGAALRVVDARGVTRDLLRAEGLEEKIGRIDRFSSVADVLDTFRSMPADTKEVSDANRSS